MVIWVPVLPEDDADAAETGTAAWRDPRVVHVWDGTTGVSQRFARRLSLRGPGWDLYLIYDRGDRWDADLPPMPAFWMHQLSPATGAKPALNLGKDSQRLENVLAGLLTT